ncbi:uncharacterized protein LOC122500732 [Leptopilina heterotoma]|uniref:uncharacterized protein LOC122500732 n=1 Tax=Leptopilina heterotoma TaxID=63436 RepID=UPI001CA7DAA7|nr:uncharacterized protein LOC122500732 [Leptopilina heterotoma]
MYNKEKEYLRQIAKASEAIRRKHRMFKLGKEDAENILTTTFKPIVEPLQKIISINDIKLENADIEKREKKVEVEEEYNGENDYDDVEDDFMGFMNANEIDKTIIPDFDYDKVLGKYIYLINHNRKQCLDQIYEVHKNENGSLMMGDTPIYFKDNVVNVGNKRFNITTGLLELLFKNKTKVAYIREDDMNNYKQILIMSNAHKRKYKSSEPINTSKSLKYSNIISKLFPNNNGTSKEQLKTGTSLPKFMITKQNFQPDYIYWDDPNELVERLKLLTASQEAGNPSHNNEIMSIIEELREAKIIY